MMIMKFLLASVLLMACQASFLEYEITALVNNEGNFQKLARFKYPKNNRIALAHFGRKKSIVHKILAVRAADVLIKVPEEGKRSVWVPKNDLIALRKNDACTFQGRGEYKLQKAESNWSNSDWWNQKFKSDNGHIIKIECKGGKSKYTFHCTDGTEWEFYPSAPYAPMRLISSWVGSWAIYDEDAQPVQIHKDDGETVTFKNIQGGDVQRKRIKLRRMSELRIKPKNEAAKYYRQHEKNRHKEAKQKQEYENLREKRRKEESLALQQRRNGNHFLLAGRHLKRDLGKVVDFLKPAPPKKPKTLWQSLW